MNTEEFLEQNEHANKAVDYAVNSNTALGYKGVIRAILAVAFELAAVAFELAKVARSIESLDKEGILVFNDRD